MVARARTMLDDLRDAARECETLLGRLRPLLAEPDNTGPQTGTIGRSAPESSEPWNRQAADAYFAIWHGAGGLVNLLRYGAGMSRLRHPPAGGEALALLPNLAAGAHDDAVRTTCRALNSWARAAAGVPALDESEPWQPLPRLAGAQVECPYCRTFALRMLKMAGEVRCFFPGCTDSDGRPTRARMEPGRMTGEARLVFADGTTMGAGNG